MTPQEVIKAFIAKLANHGYADSSSVSTQMLDAAVQASSRFSGIQNVIDSMKSDQLEAEREAVEEVLGSDYAGKTMSQVSSTILSAKAQDYVGTKVSSAYLNDYNDERTTVKRVIQERKAYIFLEKYCGIQLPNKYWIQKDSSCTYWGNADGSTGNIDTGAITGSDANITLKAGDVVYGTTITSDLMQTLAQQDGISLSGDTLIIGTGVEKTDRDVVPEIGNKYTATTSKAQIIKTGSNDWIVVATSGNDTITTGGADSINAGAGNDKITVGADYASILTGAGNDTVTVSSAVNNVTIGDLSSTDTLSIKGTFSVGSAQVEDSILVITDKTGKRQIRLDNYANAKDAKVGSKTLTTWLSSAGFDIDNLQTSSSSNVIEAASSNTVEVAEDGGGRINIESDYKPTAIEESSAYEIQETGSSATTGTVTINLDDVTILSGAVTGGTISSEFPNVSSFTKQGLTINLLGVTSDTSGSTKNIKPKTLDELTDDQKTIVAGIFKWWATECLKLNKESYGIGFKSDTAMVKEINLFFYDSKGSGNTLATVWNSHSGGETVGLKLSVNMNYYSGISDTNVDGESYQISSLLDRTLAHEFTHAVMGTNIKSFTSLPQFIKEGMAELTHGIDDERGSTIFEIAYDSTKLANALKLSDTGTGTTNAYAGGYMFMRYYAKQSSLQSLVDYANPDSGEVWTITKNKDNTTTATYKVNGEVAATIKGLRSGLTVKGTTIDGITVKDGVITLTQQVVGTSKVTLSTDKNYTLALGDDIIDKKVTISNKNWTVKNGTATLKGDASAGYALSEDSMSIIYSAAKSGKTLATVSGLVKTGITAEDFSTDSNVITLKNSMVGTSKVSISGDGYTLALGSDIAKPETQAAYWVVGNTKKSSVANYNQDTTAGFTLAEDGKSASYSKMKTATLATVSGIKKVTTENEGEIKAAISIKNKKVTLNANALGTSNVSIAGEGYTIALGSAVAKPTTQAAYWTVSNTKKGTTATYKQDTTAGFTMAEDGKSASYSKLKTATLATVSGIKKVTAENEAEIKAAISIDDKNVITLGANALDTSKVSVKEDGYTLALGSTVAKPTTQAAYWTVNNTKKGTTATYKQDTTAGFTMADDNKSATYSKLKTATLATVSGIKKVTTDNEAEIKAAISINDNNVITLGANALGTANVSVKEDGYTIALANDVPKPTLQTAYWTASNGKSSSTATYKQDTTEGFTMADGNKSATYSKLKTATLATVTGLKKGLTVTDAKTIEGITVEDKVITLGAKALGTSSVSIKNGDYTLALGSNVPKPTTQTAYWTITNGKNSATATYKQDTTAGFTMVEGGKSATYSKLKTVTLATITGLKKGLTVNDAKTIDGISVTGNVISLDESVLGTSNVEVKGGDYTLSIDESLKTAASKERWKVDGTTATYDSIKSRYFTPSENNKKLTFNKENSITNLVTVSGLKKGAKVDATGYVAGANGVTAIYGGTGYGTRVMLTGDENFSNTVKVSLSTGYTLNSQLTTSGVNKTYWSVKDGKGSLIQDRSAGYTSTTKGNTQTLTYSAAKSVTVATVKGLKSNLTDSYGLLDGLEVGGDTIMVDSRVVSKSDISVSGTGGYKLVPVTTGIYAITTEPKENTIWAVSGTTATYKSVNTAYFKQSSDKKLEYEKQTDNKTIATISGIKKNAPTDSFTVSGNTITLGQDALPDTPTAKTKITISTSEPYTLKLGRGIPTVGYDTIAWEYSDGKATLKATVRSDGYATSVDGKTITYMPTDSVKTFATLSGVKSSNGISISDGVITLGEAALNEKSVTLTTSEGYTLAINNNEVNSPKLISTAWGNDTANKITTATLKGTFTPGYTVASNGKSITYSKATNKTLATVKGLASNTTALDDVSTTATAVNLTGSKLSSQVTVSGSYAFNFAGDYKDSTIIGSKSADTMTVAGSGMTVSLGAGNDNASLTGGNNTVTGGTGNDSIKFGGGNNIFVYASGDGNDVIADFTTNTDKIKVTSGKVSVTRDGNDAIVKVGTGSITLTGKGGQTINIVDKNDNKIDYSVASADLLESDNFLSMDSGLDTIMDSSFNAYSLDNIDITDQNLKTLTKQSSLVTYGDKK